MNSKIIFTVIFSFLLASCGGNANKPNNNNTDVNMIVCPQDAMQCPDGSWVGRSGSKCEFVCPQSQPK